jgi:microcystin-dependent protein
MSSPFLGEIRIFAGSFAPNGWAFCDGRLITISQNTALFSLLGTTYGGNGVSNYALPNLQGRAPLQAGQGPGLSIYDLGQSGGETTVTLTSPEMPSHTHAVSCYDGSGDVTNPVGSVWASTNVGKQKQNLYSQTPGSSPQQSAQAFTPIGGSSPHNNMPPYLTLTFIIALQGVFPSRS